MDSNLTTRKENSNPLFKNGAWITLLIILVLFISACTSTSSETEAAPISGSPDSESAPATGVDLPLVNTPWVLIAYGNTDNPTVVLDGTLVTAVLAEDGTLSGSASCNNYNTTYAVDGDKLTVSSPMAVTMMACERGMEQESSYLAALEKAQRYQITETGSLNIYYDNGAGEQVLIYNAGAAPLSGPMWNLISMGPRDNPLPVVEGGYFTAQFLFDPNFPTGALLGTTGCNDYRSSYYATSDRIKINFPSKTDNPNCAPGVPDQEQQYFAILNAATSYYILGNGMQIFAGDQVLNFSVGGPPEEEPEAGPLTSLNGTSWWLLTINNNPLIQGTEITGEFAINEDGTTGIMSGFSGCNTYSADIIDVFQIGEINSTQTACENPPGLMDQELTYISALKSSTSFEVSGGQLAINTDFGVLSYTNAPPPEVEQPIATAPPTETPQVEQPIETEEVDLLAVINAPIEGQVGQEISFDGSASLPQGAIASYNWDFGDGSVGEGAVAPHVYAAAGTFKVTLTIVDENGNNAFTIQDIAINQ